MEKISQTFISKDTWLSGPWHHEPDRVQWRHKSSELICLMVRSASSGAWCGYVGVPPGHPFFGINHTAITNSVDVHGGLDYSAPCQEDEPIHGICHVPLPGEAQAMWWFGFSCVHPGDLYPRFAGITGDAIQLTYKNEEYVHCETECLADQLLSFTATQQ